jgi:hypothetical protein
MAQIKAIFQRVAVALMAMMPVTFVTSMTKTGGRMFLTGKTVVVDTFQCQRNIQINAQGAVAAFGGMFVTIMIMLTMPMC